MYSVCVYRGGNKGTWPAPHLHPFPSATCPLGLPDPAPQGQVHAVGPTGQRAAPHVWTLVGVPGPGLCSHNRCASSRTQAWED